MKALDMNSRCLAIFLFCLMIILLTTSPVYSKNPFKLKAGAKGKVCLKCHEGFQETLKEPHLHPLLKEGECAGCHDPHTSYHKNLLTAGNTQLCYECHQGVLPQEGRSVHEIVVQGNCEKCHDPHGSKHKYQLKELGNELCFKCHKDIESRVDKNRFKHRALNKKEGCLNCHNPHGSDKSDFLLKKDAPLLCSKCHETSGPSLKKKHMNYPMEGTNCSSCHDPHGSDKRGMVFTNAHVPLSEKKCMDCHKDPQSSRPFETKRPGTELCRQCHEKMIRITLDNNRVHWPVVDNVGCSHCHSPHGTKQKKLLKGSIVNVCGGCHSDTVELQQWSINNPKSPMLCEPVKQGHCTACHSPHASDNVLLISQESISIELCGRCHEWETHSTHPIGEKVLDTRNKNLTVECLSCHKACGTANKPAMMPFDTVYELCIQCHVDRKR